MPRVVAVIPTLEAGPSLARAVESLVRQNGVTIEVVVVDNSGRSLARESLSLSGFLDDVRIVETPRNVGFGEAVNLGAAESDAPYVAVMNDDARSDADFLQRMIDALEREPRAGMAAPTIELSGTGLLDSAGLNVYGDGVGKQRAHRLKQEDAPRDAEALLPSGCAAVYRRSMLDEVGWFDADYFLYGEDTDVGLRGRLAGWKCLYVSEAVVHHDYSGTAGRASRLKAFYVERNRLWNVVKNCPLGMWPGVPFYAAARYWAHFRAARSGTGLAGESVGLFGLAAVVVSAYWATLTALPTLWRKRRAFNSKRRLSSGEFRALLERFPTTAREIAEQ